MTSSYEDIYSRFLQKCTDYDFIELDEETVYDNMEGWLHSVPSPMFVLNLKHLVLMMKC